VIIDSGGVIVPVKFTDVLVSIIHILIYFLNLCLTPNSHEVSLLLYMVLDQSAGVSWGHVFLGWVGDFDTGRREQMVESEGHREVNRSRSL